LVLAIAGSGRDRERLEKLARELDAPVTFMGRVSHDDLPRLYGCADIYTMLCRNRWGGLEQEGFRRMGEASRQRAVQEFSYEMLAERLGNVFGVWS
jgi:glycosyltransferase involved in cell wall biosynthesis